MSVVSWTYTIGSFPFFFEEFDKFLQERAMVADNLPRAPKTTNGSSRAPAQASTKQERSHDNLFTLWDLAQALGTALTDVIDVIDVWQSSLRLCRRTSVASELHISQKVPFLKPVISTYFRLAKP